MDIYHLKFQDVELGYVHQRWPDEKSTLMAPHRVGKTKERLLGMDILPLSPTPASASDTSAEANKFLSCDRGKAGIET